MKMAQLPMDAELPPDNHFVRHVSSRSVNYDPDTDEIQFLKPDALFRRETEEGLSGAHLEHFDGERIAQCRAVRQALIDAGRAVRAKHVLALMRVETLLAAGNKKGHQLRVVSKPLENFPSHAEIRRMPVRDDALAVLLAAEIAAADIHWMGDLVPNSPALAAPAQL